MPPPSISAVGSGLVRRSPATPWNLIFETATSFDQVAPPSVERKAPIVPWRLSNGTIDRAVGLHDRLAAEALRVDRPATPARSRSARRRTTCSCTRGRPRRSCRTPCSSGRRTGWPGGCRRPSSSCRGRPCAAGGGISTGRAEGRAAVGRAAHEDRRDAAAREQRDRGDHPDVVPGVVGDAGVAHALVRAGRVGERAGVEGEPGQEARRVPRRAAVAGARAADVGGAAVEEAADLDRPRRPWSRTRRCRARPPSRAGWSRW